MFVAFNLGRDLLGDLGWNDVRAIALTVFLPHEARSEEVLVLDVYRVLRTPDLVDVPVPPSVLLFSKLNNTFFWIL